MPQSQSDARSLSMASISARRSLKTLPVAVRAEVVAEYLDEPESIPAELRRRGVERGLVNPLWALEDLGGPTLGDCRSRSATEGRFSDWGDDLYALIGACATALAEHPTELMELAEIAADMAGDALDWGDDSYGGMADAAVRAVEVWLDAACARKATGSDDGLADELDDIWPHLANLPTVDFYLNDPVWKSKLDRLGLAASQGQHDGDG
jgi:hypothetical protein